jgi:glycosyltransferase involved in cell wall biosynthesis
MVSLTFYPGYSGAGIQAWRLCQKLAARGVKVEVLSENTDRNTRRETIGGIPVCRLPVRGRGRGGALQMAARILSYLIRYRRRYDLLHVHGAYWYAQAVILFSRIFRKKTIVKMSLSGDDDPISIRDRQLFGRLGFRILGMADRIISTSPELSESYRRSGLPADRLEEIPNGVDAQLFSPVSDREKPKIRRGLGLPADGFIVTFTGRICHRKGLDILIKAWAEVSREFPQARLRLIGPNNDNLTDPYVRDLHDRIKELNLTDKVAFTGQVSNMNEHLQASDVFAFPSRREGMPNAILEAMACGLTCVAMATSCVSGIITDGVNGLIFGAEDSHQLAQYLSQLIKEPAFRYKLGSEARQTIVKKFSIEFVSEQYLKLYKKLMRLSHEEINSA